MDLENQQTCAKSYNAAAVVAKNMDITSSSSKRAGLLPGHSRALFFLLGCVGAVVDW